MTIATDIKSVIASSPFAENSTVTWQGNTITAVFRDFYIDAQGMESSIPSLIVADSVVSGIAHGDQVTVDGTGYTVRGIEPNGYGKTVIILELNA